MVSLIINASYECSDHCQKKQQPKNPHITRGLCFFSAMSLPFFPHESPTKYAVV